MGNELLTASSDKVEGDSDETGSPFFIAKMLDECFPYYLSIGMTYEQYWYGEAGLVKAYRKAEELRNKRKNWDAWYMGRYVYDGIMRLVPSLQTWKPKEPLPYMEEPYPLTQKEYDEYVKRKRMKQQAELREQMKQFAMEHNRKKKEQKDG